jgi:hypothetical protein
MMEPEGFESGYYDMITISYVVGGVELVGVVHEVLERYYQCVRAGSVRQELVIKLDYSTIVE